ncbi:carboxypeptidase regulatory-like domain-containing protein [Hyalangium sp.]|uniref:carboxypeptidase regulatory-like domain-containing protein n=1 Tax=Hyalangium sp. TaxID=2028555 RepID=UPI002D559D92|nr:carboxypeptidase regulatory-like domain-containing protein [Hyalangium sp.]HYH95796.1 carboxypeptidase regulatory-like domain-containing protein [Hyalangium sp.]
MKLRTFGLALIGAAGLVILPACTKDEASKPSTPTAAANPAEQGKPATPTPTQAQTPTSVGKSTLRGVVKFTGTAPAAAEIAPSSDPACEGMALKEPAVLVKDGKLQNVLVRVKGPVAGAPAASSTPVVIDQVKCTYTPRVMGAQAGQPLQVKNSDGTLHNVRAMVGTKSLFNLAQPPEMAPVTRPTPSDVELIQLKCDVHPWMKSFIAVSPHPYFSTTGEDGAFSITALPAGTYTLEAWHETFGTKTAEVTVKDGETAEASFEFAGTDKG